MNMRHLLISGLLLVSHMFLTSECNKHLVGHAVVAHSRQQVHRHPIIGNPATCAQNMQDFFKRFSFGKVVAQASQDTHSCFYFNEGAAEIFQVIETIHLVHAEKPIMYAGDYFYLDLLHKDHLEVFDATLHARTVINLDGTENMDKKLQALEQKRVIRLHKHNEALGYTAGCASEANANYTNH